LAGTVEHRALSAERGHFAVIVRERYAVSHALLVGAELGIRGTAKVTRGTGIAAFKAMILRGRQAPERGPIGRNKPEAPLPQDYVMTSR